ncbi:MAG: GatB/YqeY domain-containing protein [Betaproteobacteria bacterium]|jgi:uncharacterized protein YqeY|nr:GatB/YqeY domain-containing protein [Betaproteobacteria bacterium]
MTLKEQIQDDMKAAMRAKDAARLGTIRLLIAAFRQREIDDQTELDDLGVTAVIDRMLKQRRDSIAQFEAAGREDLAVQERSEVDVLSAYLPQPFSDTELDAVIDAALGEALASKSDGSDALSAADMGRVMGILKPRLAGRADVSKASSLVKGRLSAVK